MIPKRGRFPRTSITANVHKRTTIMVCNTKLCCPFAIKNVNVAASTMTAIIKAILNVSISTSLLVVGLKPSQYNKFLMCKKYIIPK